MKQTRDATTGLRIRLLRWLSWPKGGRDKPVCEVLAHTPPPCEVSRSFPGACDAHQTEKGENGAAQLLKIESDTHAATNCHMANLPLRKFSIWLWLN